MKASISGIIGPFKTDLGDHCRVELKIENRIEEIDAGDAIIIRVALPAPRSATLDQLSAAAQARAIELLRSAAEHLSSDALEID